MAKGAKGFNKFGVKAKGTRLINKEGEDLGPSNKELLRRAAKLEKTEGRTHVSEAMADAEEGFGERGPQNWAADSTGFVKKFGKPGVKEVKRMRDAYGEDYFNGN